MALNEYKISAEEISEKGVVAAPDKLSGTARENKELFDRLIREMVAEKINGLIDQIVEELAGKMPAPPFMGVPGQYLRIGEGGVEWGVPGGSGDMIAAVYDTDGDGSVNRADVAGRTEGNASTAARLQTARSLRLQDADGSNAGEAVGFDGSGDIILKLPGRIRANLVGDVSGSVTGSSGSCTGNAETATKLRTARTLTIRDASGVYSGGSVAFDGSGSIVLTLPDTLKLTALVAGAGLAGTAYPENPVEGQLFFLEEAPAEEEEEA